VATRKTTDDMKAREHARYFLTDRGPSADDSALVVDLFDTAEFETATSRVGGAEITLRRVVLTGPWEVVTK
jgi:hypothetical protein